MKASYWGKTFSGFFQEMFLHIVEAFKGNYHIADLAADEIQIITLSFLGISCAIIGSILVIRKMTMVANAISHTVLLGIIVSFLILHYFFARPFSELLDVDMKLLIGSGIISSLLTMWFTDFFNTTLRLKRDSSIGLVFTFLFSIGILLVTIFTRNTHIGAEIIMGNVDMIHLNDILIALFLLFLNLATLILFFKEIVVTSFDPQFAKLSKISPEVMNYIVILLTSFTLVGAFRAVGVVLVLALIVVPTVTARFYSNRLKSIICISALISFLAAIFSVALTRHILSMFGFALSTSAMMVTILFLIWLLSLLYKLTLTLKRGSLRRIWKRKFQS